VIVIAATNLPESLDDAILRPGRFDKHVYVQLPDIKGRKSLFDLYLKKAPTSPDVQIDVLAKQTPGLSGKEAIRDDYKGADISAMVNQAKILASLENSRFIQMKHLERAREDTQMGRERKSAVLSEETRRLTAYHEGGHAIVSLFTNSSSDLHKATIIPRGQSLGHVSKLPNEENFTTKEKLMADLDVCMGGRVAEEIIFGPDKVTPGARSDFQQATAIAKSMVTNYGMSEKVISFRVI
jgi:ATP-dependent Zn protease